VPVGPVQLLVVVFKEPHFSGEIIEELKRLLAIDLIRLIDVLVVQKDLDGSVTAVQVSDLTIGEAEEMGAVIGARIAGARRPRRRKGRARSPAPERAWTAT